MADLKISQLQAHTTPIDNDLLAIVDTVVGETKKISVSNLLASKQDSLGFTPENIANKENVTIDTSTTKYPTVNLLKTGLDAKIDKSIVNAKGDILTATADDTPARLAVGTDGQVLTADSNESTGLKYTTPLSASSTNTLTNKRINPRVTSETSSATPTINTDNTDIHRITALAVDITSMTTNLSGTPTHGQKLIIEITGTAARAITWGASFEASTATLPTTTVTTAMLSVGLIYNSATSKWRCVAVA